MDFRNGISRKFNRVRVRLVDGPHVYDAAAHRKESLAHRHARAFVPHVHEPPHQERWLYHEVFFQKQRVVSPPRIRMRGFFDLRLVFGKP